MTTWLNDFISTLELLLNYWDAILWFVLAYLALEFMEHSKEGKWPKGWKIFGWEIGRKWMNTPTAWRNKDDFGGDSKFWDWLFDTALVFLTDAEHFFQLLMFIFIGIGVNGFTNSSAMGWAAFIALAVLGGVVKALIQKLFPKMKIR